MRNALRIAGRVALWALVVTGGLAIALCVFAFIVTDEPDARPGIAIFTAILVAAEASVVYLLRRRPRPERGDEPSAAEVEAYERLRAGQPILLRPSPRRWRMLLALFLGLTAMCVWAATLGELVFGLLGTAFFGLGAVLAVLNLIPGRAYLRIAPDGLVARHPLRTSRWDWNDVENFAPFEIYHYGTSTKQVVFDQRNLTPDRQGLWKTIGRGMSGADVALPDTYGLDNDALAALLEEARDRYATEHGLSPSARADIALAEQAARVRRDRIPVVTVLLVGTCIAVFAVEVSRYGWFPTAQELFDAGGAAREALADGRWWTLLTANVLHANPIHLILNLVALTVIGVLLEREVGWARFGVACLAGGVAAMGLAVLITGDTVTIGASGIVFAISGWALLRDMHSTRALGAVAWATLPVGVIYTFFAPHVSIGAHMSGLLAGLAVGHLFERGRSRELASQPT